MNPFSVHSLLFGTSTTPDTLPDMLRRVEAAGGKGLEAAFHPNMFDIAHIQSLGAICVAENVPITALCVFFGNGDLDPLNINDRENAINRLRTAAICAKTMGKITGTTPVITGPWAYQIGKPYKRDTDTLRQVELFLQSVELMSQEDLGTIKFALEVLRPAENFAIQGHAALADILSNKASNIGAHLDTFHLQLWGDDVCKHHMLTLFGSRLFWFHVSGQDRRTPGSHVDERINWKDWAQAIRSEQYTGPICFEGFGPSFRAAVPEIGNGFPEDMGPDKSIQCTLENLRKAGFDI